MKIRQYKDPDTGKVGVVLIAESCCEEETLIKDLLNKKIEIVPAKILGTGAALVMDKEEFDPFSNIKY